MRFYWKFSSPLWNRQTTGTPHPTACHTVYSVCLSITFLSVSLRQTQNALRAGMRRAAVLNL